MIFQHTFRLVLAGRKTQTRRLGRPRMLVGRSYAVQPGRGQRAVGRIVVTGIRQQRLGDISLADARAEGYASREEFLAAWSVIRDAVDQDLVVWVVEFGLVGRMELRR